MFNNLLYLRSAKTIIEKFIYYCIILLCVINIDSCGQGSSPRVSNPNNIDNSLLNLGNVTTIPLINSQYGYTYMVVSNNSEQNLNLTNTIIETNNHITNGNKNSMVDATECVSILAHQTCKVKLYKPQTSGNYLITMLFTDASGNQYSDNQIISYSSQMNMQDGFYYSTQNSETIHKVGQETFLSVPVVLGNDYSNVQSSSDDLQTQIFCPNNQYTNGTLCTILVSGNFTANSSNSIMLSGTKLSGDLRFSILTLGTTAQNIGNLITSGVNVVINPAIASNLQQVWLSNKGLATVTITNILPATPITMSSNTCGTTLAIGATCSFFVNVTSSNISGQSPLAINYFDGLNNQLLSFNIAYLAPTPGPSLSLITNKSLYNVPINRDPAFLKALVTNNGNTPFFNFGFTLGTTSSGFSTFNSGNPCPTSGGILNVGATCSITLVYSPTVVESGTVTIYPVASYLDNNNQTLSYTNASLVIPYSSNNPTNSTNFIAVGDFGTVVNSTNGTSWTVKINSPTTVNTQAINSMVNSGSTYVLGSSTGIVSQSTVGGGLIWGTAGTVSGTPTSINGLAADSSGNFYAATSNTGLLGNGVVSRSPSPVGTWTTQFTAPSLLGGDQVNNIFLLNTGFLATLSAPQNAGNNFATSANGTTWAVATVSGANSLIYSTALYDGTSFYAWNSNGLNAKATSVTGSWTQNAVGPGTTTVTGSVFNSGTYVLTTTTGATNGVIYTATNATSGPYTARLTITLPLNSIAYGNGTFVAVGNTGTIYSTTTPTGTWSARTSGTTANLTYVYYDGTFFWATGAAGIMLVSPDGINWSIAGLTSLTYNNSIYIAVGVNGLIYTSSNLTNWTKQSSGTINVLNEVVCPKSNQCIAAGNNGTILNSTNGTTWSSQTSGSSNNLNAMTCASGGNCVIVGSNGTILTNPNISLNSWSTQTSPSVANINSVSYTSSNYVAVGNSGLIMTSPDGITWSIVGVGVTTNNLNSVTCNSNGCVAVGNGGTILTSGQGLSWVAQISGTTNNLSGVAYYNGRHIAVGALNTTITSTNFGVTWSATTATGISSTGTNLNFIYTY